MIQSRASPFFRFYSIVYGYWVWMLIISINKGQRSSLNIPFRDVNFSGISWRQLEFVFGLNKTFGCQLTISECAKRDYRTVCQPRRDRKLGWSEQDPNKNLRLSAGHHLAPPPAAPPCHLRPWSYHQVLISTFNDKITERYKPLLLDIQQNCT